MHGVVNFLKPPGMTSHDAVALLRRTTGVKRIGHTGTLDPAAAGVLPMCIGQATRLVEYLQEGVKEYVAELTFGHETDTCDALGKVIATPGAQGITRAGLLAALPQFLGAIEQMPPIYSAIKRDGKKLYELARAGETEDSLDLQPRAVTIAQLSIERFVDATTDAPPRAILRTQCSGGTYIRSLVRDIGRAMGSGATMTFLVRTRNGRFPIAEAVTVEDLGNNFVESLIPMRQVLPWCVDEVIENPEAARRLAHGQIVKLEIAAPMHSGRILVRDAEWTLAAIAVARDDAQEGYKAEKVLDLATAID